MKEVIVVGAIMLATPVPAQSPPASARERVAQAEPAPQLQVRLMERALEDAVTRGVRVVERQLPSVSGLVFFAGPVRVRGFELEDYGVFFDVEYPVVRRSILWSMNTLQLNGGMPTVLQDIRRRLQTMPEGPGQLAFEQILSKMEAELQRSAPRSPADLGAARVSSAEDAGTSRPDRLAAADLTMDLTMDPLEVYLTTLTGELTDAMLSHGPALRVAEDGWVSVAARDGRGQLDPRVSGPRQTLKLRVRGRDLEALRAGRLSVDEVRRLVEGP